MVLIACFLPVIIVLVAQAGSSMAAIKKPVPHHLCFADSLCWKKSTPLHSTSFDLASKRMADVFLSLLTTPICPITLKIEKEWELEWKKWCNWSVFYSNGRTDHSQLWVFSSCCLKHGGEWMGGGGMKESGCLAGLLRDLPPNLCILSLYWSCAAL